MVRLNVTRVGFLMGVSLLLAAIIYFFAANWSGMGRADKILSAAGILVLFYGAAYFFSKMKMMLGHHSFLSASLLVGGCISFGAAVALLHQIYHSQADTFELFLVWSVPALLFALITRNQVFYILAYVLVHLTLWQLFYPTSLYVRYTDGQLLLIGGLFAFINLVLLALTEIKWLKSYPLKAMSFIVFHGSLLILSNAFEHAAYNVWTNVACVASIAIGFYYFAKVRLDRSMLTLHALAASAYAVAKFVRLMSEHASTTFFSFGLLFVALLLTGNVLFFRYLNRLNQGGGNAGGEAVDEEPDIQKSAVIGKAVSTIVTVIGILIGSISLVGLVMAASGDIEPQYTLFVFSLLFIIPVVLIKKANNVIRYTLLTIGFAAGMVSIAWMDQAGLSLLFLIVTIAGWFRLQGRAQHLFTYLLLNINAAILLFQLLGDAQHAATYTVFLLTILNAVILVCRFLLRNRTSRRHLWEGGLFFTLLFLFWLTFMEDIYPHSNLIFNIFNFIMVTGLVFVFVRRSLAFESVISLVFWFVYIAFKYYDLLWTLLHKSVTLALLGLIIITVTYVFAYRTRASVPEETNKFGGILRKSPVLIAMVIVLQLGYIGHHAAASELLLSNGTAIKLQIEPLDPRSMLQGDYITLNYTISTPPQAVAAELEARPGLSRIKVVLRPDNSGVYVFDRIYEEREQLADHEVLIKGRVSGWQNIYYGIESYFIPEGTGAAAEQTARFAYVRVNSRGDALLERVSRE